MRKAKQNHFKLRLFSTPTDWRLNKTGRLFSRPDCFVRNLTICVRCAHLHSKCVPETQRCYAQPNPSNARQQNDCTRPHANSPRTQAPHAVAPTRSSSPAYLTDEGFRLSRVE